MRHDIGDYIASDYTSHGKFMDDETYAKALDSLVFLCVDVLPMVGDKLLIAKRAREPQADWWMFGGRMRTGETLYGSARRLMEVEMGVDFQEERFDYLTTWIAAWKMRAQVPEDHGPHNASITLTLTLAKSELAEIKLNDEYLEMKQVLIEEIIEDASYHPALRQSALAWRHRLLET